MLCCKVQLQIDQNLYFNVINGDEHTTVDVKFLILTNISPLHIVHLKEPSQKISN